MNKYQETLNFIENVVIDELSNGYDEPRYFRDFHPGVIRAMQELVDKEIPMKPINNKYDKILGMEQTYTCPRCRNACLEMLATNKRNINRYCYDCGQKIDWSDE